MARITIKEAEQQGFIIDTCCYPPLAYKGARFNPTEKQDCFTEIEAVLLEAVDSANKLIYAKGAPLGSENYFEIRTVLSNATRLAKGAQ